MFLFSCCVYSKFEKSIVGWGACVQDHWTYACDQSDDYDTCANFAKATCDGMSDCIGFTVPIDPSWRQNIIVYPGENDNDQCVRDNIGFSSTWDFYSNDITTSTENPLGNPFTAQIKNNKVGIENSSMSNQSKTRYMF